MPAKKLFTLTLSPNPARNKRAVEILDQSGVDYRVIEAGVARVERKGSSLSTAVNLPQLKYGSDVIDDPSRRALIDFLWAHGAHFEDS